MAQHEYECCAFCDALDYYSVLRKTKLSEEECFENALELFAEMFFEELTQEFYDQGWKEGYAMAFEGMAKDITLAAQKIKMTITDPNEQCEDCDCDGDCYR